MLCLSLSFLSIAQTDSVWSYHYQTTVISQSHAGFYSMYSGKNSLADSVEIGATTLTSTMFIGRKITPTLSFFLNPEVAGGEALSSASGVAGALNGESFRVGNPSPQIYIARAYIQKTFPLSSEIIRIDDDQNQISHNVSSRRMNFYCGKFSLGDFHDNSQFSHDPRGQFFNWALMDNGTWDYAANTRGYTFGTVIEYIDPEVAIKLSTAAEPGSANSSNLEYSKRVHAETFEIEKNIAKGKISVLLYHNFSRTISYEDGILALKNQDSSTLNIFTGDSKNNHIKGEKWGIGLNLEKNLTDDIGVFSRIGWNDGKYASWTFTEIDKTATIGISVSGLRWKRHEDVAALAIAINGISDVHREFLKRGGYGFIIGDGNLDYSTEQILETYYNIKVASNFNFTLDYQFIRNPGYNSNRGPVHVFGLRGHLTL